MVLEGSICIQGTDVFISNYIALVMLVAAV